MSHTKFVVPFIPEMPDEMEMREELVANARLIAAAPILLETVKDALMMCRKHGIDSTWECALEKVIALAEGKEVIKKATKGS